MRSGFAISLWLLACSSAASPPTVGPVPTSEPPAPVAEQHPSDCVCGTAPGCLPCAVPTARADASSPGPTGAPPTRFPPADLTPPFERTAKPGDGVWAPMPAHGASAGTSPLARTTLHPHGIRGDVVMELVAIDTSRLTMDLVLGTEEPEGFTAAEPPRTGLVPAGALDRLVAVTNGGFKKRHGGHGVGVGGTALVPPRADFCTFAKTKAGAYRVGVWSALEPEAQDLSWFRQTPPCLVENGAKNPDTMNEYKAKRWGGAEDGRKDIRRSAIGLGADPAVLYFAIGDWVTSEWIANGLVAAGITTAAELDINYSYTRFIVYEHKGPGELVATSPLLKELKAPRKEYWSEPSARDFFFLALR